MITVRWINENIKIQRISCFRRFKGMATVEYIKLNVLGPYQSHKQLSFKEANFLSLELIDLLSQTECKDISTLKFVSRFFTKAVYGDLIDERNINKKCGYPLCDQRQGRVRDLYENSLVSDFLRQNSPYKYLTSFCSKYHFKCSQFYQVQLSDEGLFGRVGVHLDGFQGKNVIVLEEASATNVDMKSIIRDLETLYIAGKSPDSSDGLQKDFIEWVDNMKIVENE